MNNSRLIAIVTLVLSLGVVGISVWYTSALSSRLAIEEQKRVETWVEATQHLIDAPVDEDISFEMTVIEGNTTVPVYMVDGEGHLLDCRNVRDTVEDARVLNGPIELHLPDGSTQYIYYDESTLLHQLHYVPYVQFALILIFVLVAVVMIITTLRSEQNRVWAGLSKETAHQLGTPISSLNAWQQILSDKYPEDELIPMMERDISRLSMIADRFSKVGSTPELTPTPLEPMLDDAVAYMRSRLSNKVQIYTYWAQNADAPTSVEMSAPLMAWVIENLMKNAVDAMEGRGSITISTRPVDDWVEITVTDTGKGMDARTRRRVFQPGFTTKSRGWGLGLTLCKRIVEQYHRGQLFIQQTRVGVGTTFAIRLHQSKHH